MKNLMYSLILLSMCSCSDNRPKFNADEYIERTHRENLALLNYSEEMIEIIKSDLKKHNTLHNGVPSIEDPF